MLRELHTINKKSDESDAETHAIQKKEAQVVGGGTPSV